MNNFKPVNGNWIQTIAYMLKDIDTNLSNEFAGVNNQLSASTDVIVSNFQTTNNGIENIINQINLANETNNIMLNSINGKLDELIDKDCSPVINLECPTPIVNVECPTPIINVDCPEPVININCPTPNQPGNNKPGCVVPKHCIHPQKPKLPPLPCIPPKQTHIPNKPKECIPQPIKKDKAPIISKIDANHLIKLNQVRKIR
jgi:hypothetical protein